MPLAHRNAPTKLMKSLGYGAGYRYDHEVEGRVALDQVCLPPELDGRTFYQPVDQGLEIRLREKLEALRVARAAARTQARGRGNVVER